MMKLLVVNHFSKIAKSDFRKVLNTFDEIRPIKTDPKTIKM